jgi:hypothetical protein
MGTFRATKLLNLQVRRHEGEDYSARARRPQALSFS